MLLQVAATADAEDWFGLIGVLFSTVIGPLFVLRHGRRRQATRAEASAMAVAAPEPLPEVDDEGYPTRLQVFRLPAGPPTTFLSQASVRELTEARRSIPPGARDSVARRWLGGWVRWGGVISDISEQEHLVTLMLVDSRGGFIFLNFPPSHKNDVESLREGDRITFTGQLRELTDMCADLVRVEVDKDRPDRTTDRGEREPHDQVGLGD